MRFQQLHNYIEENKPEVFLEIGTWNGNNAKHCMSLGVKRYVGFDVFEEGSDELDQIENNVKKRVSEEDVRKVLGDVELIKGNTRKTLPEYVKDKTAFVDVALIDGGHSSVTIRSDLMSLLKVMKPTGAIFLDDYYFKCPNPDIGSNTVLGDLRVPYTVLPVIDKVKGGYFTKMARIDMRNVPTKNWNMPEEISWKYEP